MSVKFPVKIEFSAVDRLTSAVKGINEKIQKATEPARAVGGKFGALGQALGLKDIGKAFSNVGSAASNLRSEIQGAALAAGALVATVVGGSFALVKGFAEAADNIGDTAERLGISTTALQEYRYAAKIAGVEQEGFDKALQKLGQHLAEGSVGMGEALPVFQALGIGTKDATGKVRQLEDVLPELADKFQKIGNASVRNALAVKIFGKEGAKMSVLLKDGAAGLEAMRKEARDLGGVIGKETVERAGKFGDTLDKVKFALDGVRNIVAAELLPVFESLSADFLDFVKTHREDFVALGQAIKVALVEVLGLVKIAFAGVIDAAKRFNALPLGERVTLIRLALAAFAAIILGPVVLALFAFMGAIGQAALSVGVLIAKMLMLNTAFMSGFRIAIASGLGPMKAFIAGLFFMVDTAFPRVGAAILSMMGVFSKLGTAIAWLGRSALLVAPWAAAIAAIIGVGYLIVTNWEEIKQWFVTLWNDPAKALGQFVDLVFSKLGALWDWIKAKFGNIFGTNSPSLTINGAPAGSETALNAINASQTNRSEARVQVDFNNVPRGTQVSTSPQSSAPLNLNLGYAGVYR